ncbi:MAG: hypothetical protein ABTA16_00080 [Niallia sp.]
MVKSYNEDVQEYGAFEPYTSEEIEEMKSTNVMIPVRFKRLLATIEDKETEIKRLEKFIENLQDVHFVELQQEKSKVKDLENEVRCYKNRIPTNPGTVQRGLEYGC